MSTAKDDEIAHADLKISQSYEALSNQIALIFRMKSFDINGDIEQRKLDDINRELRQWIEYRALLIIRKRMLAGD